MKKLSALLALVLTMQVSAFADASPICPKGDRNCAVPVANVVHLRLPCGGQFQKWTTIPQCKPPRCLEADTCELRYRYLTY